MLCALEHRTIRVEFRVATNEGNKAIGVSANEKGGVTVVSKKPKSAHQPASGSSSTTYGGHKSSTR